MRKILTAYPWRTILVWSLIPVIIITGMVILFVGSTLLFNMSLFLEEGEGIILNKRNTNAGLFVTVDSGWEIRIPPITGLWGEIQTGDFLSKKKYSFLYRHNAATHHVLFEMLVGSLKVGGWFFVIGFVGSQLVLHVVWLMNPTRFELFQWKKSLPSSPKGKPQKTFAVEATDEHGKLLRLALAAESQEIAQQQITQRGLTLRHISEISLSEEM